MQRRILPSLLLAFLFAFSFVLNAQEHGSELHAEHDHPAVSGENDPEANKELIQHHLLDSYEFHITGNVGFPLPVILIDNGLHVFMSSAFHKGESVAESNGNYYKIYHNKIYKTDQAGTLEFDEHHHSINEMPFDISITKNVFVILFMAAFMFWIFRGIAKNYRSSQLPKGAGSFLEPIIVYVRDEIAIPNIGEKHYKKYMSYLLTVFFFIWFINLLGMTPLGINVTGNIAITFGLAMVTFFITQFTGKKTYWAHIFWMPGVPVFMKIVLAPIELLGVFIKPFALMIRLYANMKAGHIVIMSLIAVMYTMSNWGAKGAFVGLTLMLFVIELLVAALQAYIFTMLTALYFGAASEEHDH